MVMAQAAGSLQTTHLGDLDVVPSSQLQLAYSWLCYSHLGSESAHVRLLSQRPYTPNERICGWGCLQTTNKGRRPSGC